MMHQATMEAIGLARETGAGWVSVCHSSHCGALDYFGLRIARAGMIERAKAVSLLGSRHCTHLAHDKNHGGIPVCCGRRTAGA